MSFAVKNNPVIAVEKLRETPYAEVLCYPRLEQQVLEDRIRELKGLGVLAIEFSGGKTVSNLKVLGKGCVGIVVAAYTRNGKAALKIRRTDADRKGMQQEAEMLKKANTLNVGPALLGFSSNFLLMEFVEGKLLPEWLDSLKGEKEHVKTRIKRVLRKLLAQCWRMDKAGLDHGELNHAPKHIIIKADDSPCIVDFETASTRRKPSNLTSLCQYLFISSMVAEKLREKLGEIGTQRLVEALRAYKRSFSEENFRRVLSVCGLPLDEIA